MKTEKQSVIVFGRNANGEEDIHYAEVDPSQEIEGDNVKLHAIREALRAGMKSPCIAFDEADQARALFGMCDHLQREAEAYEQDLDARVAESAQAEETGSAPADDPDMLAVMRQIRDALHGKELVGALRIAEDQIAEIQLTFNGSELDERVTQPMNEASAEPVEEPSFFRGPQHEYRVRWEIDVDAPTPEKAVERARAIYSRPWLESRIYDVFSEEGGQVRVERFNDGSVESTPIDSKADSESRVPAREVQ